jgi:uncharacterized protein (DUF1697 family)
MKTYAALLRGVNVSGHNKVPMKELRARLAGLGFTDVATYIQSGNIVFHASASPDLAGLIERDLRKAFGVSATVLLRTKDQLVRVGAQNPFVKRGVDVAALHVTFLAETPKPARVKDLTGKVSGPDELVVRGREVYLRCPNGYGRTKLTNTFLERQLGSPATTRNWRTVLQLVAMTGSP